MCNEQQFQSNAHPWSSEPSRDRASRCLHPHSSWLTRRWKEEERAHLINGVAGVDPDEMLIDILADAKNVFCDVLLVHLLTGKNALD